MASEDKIKCVVWDLDNTLWDGILAESGQVQLRPGIRHVIETLDSRGILHSIASKNNYDRAMLKLRELKLDEFFICPQIGWDAKSLMLEAIQKKFNVAFDTFLFIDDQYFELDEVKDAHPEITTRHADEYKNLLNDLRLQPIVVTSDSRKRRSVYQNEMMRKHEEEHYQGPSNEFMASLGLRFFIIEATTEDLRRAEELTIRTNQLNATGETYDYDQLSDFLNSDNHKLFVCELEDKYGIYGKVGLALIEMNGRAWKIKLILMSCRVISRGVGTVLLTYIMGEAKKNNKQLLADFRDTGVNKMMYVSFCFAGFVEKLSLSDGRSVLQHDLKKVPKIPNYIDVVVRHLKTSEHSTVVS